MSKKILFISTLESVAWGGSEELWADMALRYLQMGFEVCTSTIFWEQTPDKVQQIAAAGGTTLFRPNIHTHGARRHWLNNRIGIRKVYKAMEDFNPDIIIVSQSGTFDDKLEKVMGQWLLARNKPFYLISQHLSEYGYLHDKRRSYFRSLFDKAEKVFFVSRRNMEVAQRMLCSSIPNAVVIKNPIKVRQWDHPFPAGFEIRFAAVARLDAEVKGLDILIECFADESWHDGSVKLDIYGSGRDKQYLEELIRFRKAEDKISLKGHVKDVEEIWKTHPMLVLSSRSEGTPLSLLEAGFCNRPAVVTDVGGNTEVVKDGVTGFVAEAATVPCLLKALRKAWQEREHWKSMGIKAGDFVRSLYQQDAASAVIDLIRIN